MWQQPPRATAGGVAEPSQGATSAQHLANINSVEINGAGAARHSKHMLRHMKNNVALRRFSVADDGDLCARVKGCASSAMLSTFIARSMLITGIHPLVIIASPGAVFAIECKRELHDPPVLHFRSR